MRRLILCADDFAFSPETSRVIADLLRAGRLNATSCMAVMPGWPADAALLADPPAGAEIGLHVVLTDEAPLTAMPGLAPDGRLPASEALRVMADARRLPLAEVADEVRAQFDRFAAALGCAPAFVDGHEHVHVLPGIRDIVLDETARCAPGAWVRDSGDQLGAILARPFRAKALGSAFHARGLRRAAARRDLACNDGFAGHYAFAGDYAALFPAFLRRPGRMHLVMCHPGAGARAGDGIAAARSVEAEALARLPVARLARAKGLAFPG